MFHAHPSRALNEQFTRKPFQGAEPRSASFLFVGLDANYDADIESSPIYTSLLQYHEDGPAFWRATGLHHPFLLAGYNGDGRPYHRRFAKIGFQSKHANQVSFIELLHVPTVGSSKLVSQDLTHAHLSGVRKAIFESHAQFTFISSDVRQLMVSSGIFPELTKVRRTLGALRVLYEADNRAVFLHLHFSNYGRFEQRLQAEAREIAGLLERSNA